MSRWRRPWMPKAPQHGRRRGPEPCTTLSPGRVPGAGLSREDHELARRPSVLHVSVRLGDLVERVCAVDWDSEAASRDRVEVGLKHVAGEVGGVAAIGSEPDARREVLD